MKCKMNVSIGFSVIWLVYDIVEFEEEKISLFNSSAVLEENSFKKMPLVLVPLQPPLPKVFLFFKEDQVLHSTKKQEEEKKE